MKFNVNGAILNIEVDGPRAAPAILTWNGAMCTLRMWDPVVTRLRDRYRIVRIDTRGIGQSTATAVPEKEYTLEQYAEDANRVLDDLGIDRCHVWSMAWGSRAALAYCSLYPARVLSAALFDANSGPADVPAQREGSRRALERQQAAGIDRFIAPAGWNVHADPAAAQASIAAAGKFDLKGAVPRLTMPVLVATGDHDPNLEPSREIVSRAPNARLVVMTNVGHGSVIQRPDLTTDLFLDFQASLNP